MNDSKPWKYCVVGNIVKERIDENGVLRHGTAAFRGGTRVYLEGKNYDCSREDITVLGVNRHRHLAYEYIPRDQIENIRFTRIYRPNIMEMMYEYEGRDGWWNNTDEDGLDAKQFAANWPKICSMEDKEGKDDQEIKSGL